MLSLLIDEKRALIYHERNSRDTRDSRHFFPHLNFRRREFFLLDFYRFSISPLYFRDDADIRETSRSIFNVKNESAFVRWQSLSFATLSLEWIIQNFTRAHRSHRRCLITESMMKTNCCVYRNVLQAAATAATLLLSVLVCTENVMKTLWAHDVKILHRHS